MKNNRNTCNKVYVSLAMLIILGISFVSAFSVSSPYMANKTLNLFPDSKITNLEFVLQNGGGATENVTIRVNILEGSEITNITDDDNIYTVSPGAQVPVNLRITLPENVMIGNTYNVRLEFSTVTLGQSGEFGFGTGQEQSFKVVVVKEIVQKTPANFLSSKLFLPLIIGILLILLIMIMFLIRRKQKLSKK